MDIKLLAMDVDGTLTDGKLYVSEHGEAFKVFSAKDGYGIRELLPAAGITPVIITGRKSAILEHRCRELGVSRLYQGADDKLGVLSELLAELLLSLDNVAYIGDDDNDLECMRAASLAGCPADASENVIKEADFVSARCGGCGAVREFIEWIVEMR